MNTTTRFFASLLATLLPAGSALAAPAAPTEGGAVDAAAGGVRVVGLMLASGQVLLWDGEAGRYVLRQVGDSLEGGRIVALGAQSVIVEREGRREEIGLAAAPQMRVPERRVRRPPVAVTVAEPAASEEGAADAAPSAPVVSVTAPAAPAPVAAPVAAVPAVTAPPSLAPSPAPMPAPVAIAPPAPPPAALAPIAAPPAPPVPAAPAPVAVAPTPPAPPVPPAPLSVPVAAPLPIPAPVAAPAPLPAPVAAPAPAPLPPPAPMAPTPFPYARPAAPPAPPEAISPPAPSAIDPRTIVMPRAEFDRHFGNLDELDEEAAIVASQQGYQLAAIRPGGFLEALGLRSGDVVLAVDGRRIRTPDDAARAYAWLKVTDRFSVDVLRGGERIRLRYQLGG